jgi:hypothetical protein
MLATARSTPEVCDLVAFNVLDDVAVKQSILAELDVRRRVHATIEALAAVQRMLGPALRPDEVNLNCFDDRLPASLSVARHAGGGR